MKKTNVATKATANTASKGAKTPKATSKPKAENSVKKTEAPKEEPKKESKITKADMIEILQKGLTIKGLSKDLIDRINYTVKNKAKATMQDLRELVDEVAEEAKAINEAEQQKKAKAENSTKKPLKKSGKKAEEPKEEAPKTPLKSTKKPAKEEEAPKKKSLKAIDMLVEFPETLTITDGDDEIELEKVEVKKYEDVVNMLEEDEDVEIYIAVYWNKRQIQQFNYSKGGYFKVPNGKFENDLDMVNLIYPGTLTAVGISAYTEAPYIFIPESFKPDTDGMKYTEGAEFEVYKVK